MRQTRSACHPPSHPRSAEIGGPAKPHKIRRDAVPLGRHREPPRCGEVEGRRVAPYLADHGSDRGASQTFFHRPQCASGITRLDMDEVVETQSWRMHPPAFEDRHPFLHPQQWSRPIQLATQEPRPAPVSRGGGEQFGQG